MFALVTTLADTYGRENRIISIILGCFFVICFVVASSMNGYIQGKYNLERKSMTIITSLACGLFYILSKVGAILAKHILK